MPHVFLLSNCSSTSCFFNQNTRSYCSDRVLVIGFFFFFQAEDGIRDHCVTEVQTCALPICNDVRGTITIPPAGASPPGAGATLAILTYNSPFAGVPIVFVQQAGIINFFWTASDTGGFSVATAAVLTISTTYFINYIVVG